MITRLFTLWLMLASVCAIAPAQATVSTTAPRNDYVGNGATATYSYTFKIFAATDLRVTTRTTAGVETRLAYPTDYTVTGVGNKNGGTITLTAGALTTDYALTIRFDRTPRQSTDLRNQGSFFAETHEEKFDELTRYAQQLDDVVDRSLHLPETEAGTEAATTLPVAADRASKFLAWDGDGNPIAAAGTSADLTPVSSFINTLLDDANAAAARQTLLLDTHGADIASATSINLDTATGDLVDITGTTTITTITLADGVEKTVRFTGALTLTHGASLVLPGAANITTAAGDFAVFRGYAAGVVRCVQYQRASTFPQALGSIGSTPRVSSSTAVTYGAPAGYKWGLTLSNNGSDATNDIDIALGEASSSSTTYSSRVILALTSGITKRLDATWATGTNQGGRSSSVALSNTTYHVCLIRVAGVDDVGFDTSATCANLITDHSATHVRRIGSILRESAAIVAFTQTGNEFLRTTPVQDIAATNPGTSAVSRTLSVPLGVAVEAIITSSTTQVGTNAYVYLSPLTSTDSAPSASAAPGFTYLSSNTGLATWGTGPVRIRTNTSAAIRSRLSASDANTVFYIRTLGWLDDMGQDY